MLFIIVCSSTAARIISLINQKREIISIKRCTLNQIAMLRLMRSLLHLLFISITLLRLYENSCSLVWGTYLRTGAAPRAPRSRTAACSLCVNSLSTKTYYFAVRLSSPSSSPLTPKLLYSMRNHLPSQTRMYAIRANPQSSLAAYYERVRCVYMIQKSC